MIRHRPADLVDRPGNTERRFVFSSWLRSLWWSGSTGLIAAHTWQSTMIPQLDIITSRPGVKTIVAYDPKDKSKLADLLGFICGEPDSHPQLVYTCYVKEPYRRMGIARGLFAALHIDPRGTFRFASRTSDVTFLQRLGKMPLADIDSDGARYDYETRRRIAEARAHSQYEHRRKRIR